jgi:hypothetical protein
MVFCLPQNKLLMKFVAFYNYVVARVPFQTVKKLHGKVQAASTAACTAKFPILNIRHVGSQEEMS